MQKSSLLTSRLTSYLLINPYIPHTAALLPSPTSAATQKERWLAMSKATINGIEVIVYDFHEDQALCYVPEVGIKDWFNMNMIEVLHDQN